MRNEGFKCAVVCSLVLIVVGGCHRIDEDTSPRPGAVTQEVRAVPAKDRQGSVSQVQEPQVSEPGPAAEQGIESLWELFPGEPQRSFQGGRDDLVNKKYRPASEKLRKSTIYVNLQTLRAFGLTKRALHDSEVALRELSQEVEQGKIYSLERLDTTFASTQRAIARLHQEKAKGAYARGDLHTAGVELQAAKDSLGRAAVWRGDHVDPALIDASDRAADTARRLMEGTERMPAETRRALSNLGAQLDQLDRKAEAEGARGLFAGETQSYLKLVEGRLENGDLKGAAGNIRRAAACMALEAFGSYGDAKRFLEKEIEGLEQAAKEVEDGKLKSAKRLRKRFAEAQYALARVHHMQADRYYAQHYYRKAVTSLQAAAAGVERAAEWAGKEMSNRSGKVLQQVRDLSKRMREGVRVSPEEISTAISDLKKAIGRLETLAASP